MVTTTEDPQDQSDLDRLNELMRGAKAECDALEALKRKGAAIVFRCGELLAAAQTIAKKHKIGWYSLLEEHEIAESTARQAIALYRNATAAGYTAEDLETRTITEAKIEFGVIMPKPDKKEEQPKAGEEEIEPTQEAKPTQDPGRTDEQERKQEGTAQQAMSPAAPETERSKDGRRAGKEFVWKLDTEADCMVAARLKLLHDKALQTWNAGREQPFDEDYLFVLLDWDILSVEEGKVHYRPEHDEDREQLAGVLADKLAPILERWADPDDILSALKGLILPEETEVGPTAPQAEEVEAKPEAPRSQEAPKTRAHTRHPKGDRQS